MSILMLTEEQYLAHQRRVKDARVVKGKDAANVAPKPGKVSKYGNTPTEVDGVRFASKREAARYCELMLLQKSGEIRGLQLQPKFPCVVNGQKVCTYVGDFLYTKNGKRVVEDSKGYRTPLYRLKKKLVRALFGIEIVEQ